MQRRQAGRIKQKQEAGSTEVKEVKNQTKEKPEEQTQERRCQITKADKDIQ